MKTTSRIIAIACVLTAAQASAQMPEAGTISFSMAGAGMAASRGFRAVANNPANLGFSSNPEFSLNLLTVGGASGMSPVKFNDIAQFGGKIIPSTVKDEWLQRIGAGGERGTIDGGVSLAALSFGHVGFQVGALASGDASLNQDAAEAILFGNAGRTGTARDLAFSGSNANGSSFGVGAMSVGIPLMEGNHGEQLSIGVTGKFILGLLAGRARDNGSIATQNNISVQFPSIFTDSTHYGNSGSGMGLDVGLAWSNGATTFSATARNVVNTFAWSPSAFSASLGIVTFDGVNSEGHFEDTTYTLAPAAMRTALENERFKPEIAAGLAHQMGDLLIAVDGQQRIGDGIAVGPKTRLGLGAEYAGLGALALRAGASMVDSGLQMAGGFGLRIGSYELGAGVSSRSNNGDQVLGVLISLVSVGAR